MPTASNRIQLPRLVTVSCFPLSAILPTSRSEPLMFNDCTSSAVARWLSMSMTGGGKKRRSLAVGPSSAMQLVLFLRRNTLELVRCTGVFRIK